MKEIQFGRFRVKKNGINSYAMLLPKIWINTLDVKYGDYVYITMRSDGRLVLKHKPTAQGKEVGTKEQDLENEESSGGQ